MKVWRRIVGVFFLLQGKDFFKERMSVVDDQLLVQEIDPQVIRISRDRDYFSQARFI